MEAEVVPTPPLGGAILPAPVGRRCRGRGSRWVVPPERQAAARPDGPRALGAATSIRRGDVAGRGASAEPWRAARAAASILVPRTRTRAPRGALPLRRAAVP